MAKLFKAHLASDRQWYIPINEVCAALDIEPRPQRRRIQEDEAIAHRLVNIPMETPYQDTTRVQEVSCLNLRALPYWLGTIDAKRVKEEHRKKVILVQARVRRGGLGGVSIGHGPPGYAGRDGCAPAAR